MMLRSWILVYSNSSSPLCYCWVEYWYSDGIALSPPLLLSLCYFCCVIVTGVEILTIGIVMVQLFPPLRYCWATACSWQGYPTPPCTSSIPHICHVFFHIFFLHPQKYVRCNFLFQNSSPEGKYYKLQPNLLDWAQNKHITVQIENFDLILLCFFTFSDRPSLIRDAT